MRWKCIVAYDGTGFNGWQAQPNGNTVQNFIEKRLTVIFEKPVRIHGSGRTDAGVHATGQVFHFDGDWKHGSDKLLRALRIGYPEQIQIRSIKRVDDSFQARYSAIGKRYVYRIHEGYALPSELRFTWSLKGRKICFESMQEASMPLIGKHDFSSFSANNGNPEKENPVKDLRLLQLRKTGPRIQITLEASGFLYKMARSITGALVDVGLGKIPAEQIKPILQERKRSIIVPTAPARGLTLEKVYYP